MPLPCLPAAYHAAVPLAHRVLHAVGQARSQIGQHVMHRIRHVGHRVVTHTKAAVTLGCHVVPGALTVAMLALPLPAGPPQELLLSPIITPEPLPPDGVTGLSPAATMLPFGAPAWPAAGARPNPLVSADAGSTIVTLLPPDGVPLATPAALTLAPFLPPPGNFGSLSNAAVVAVPSLPSVPASTPPSTGPQAIPEPSSVVVLASALCGLCLLPRRARRPSTKLPA
jgi:hypothetical protein